MTSAVNHLRLVTRLRRPPPQGTNAATEPVNPSTVDNEMGVRFAAISLLSGKRNLVFHIRSCPPWSTSFPCDMCSWNPQCVFAHERQAPVMPQKDRLETLTDRCELPKRSETVSFELKPCSVTTLLG